MRTLKINDFASLTTEHPASHYGIPVLVNRDGRGFGPSQKTYPDKFDSIFGDKRAAHVVYSFALSHNLTNEERQFVKSYLGQWPDGPQLV